MARGVGNGLIFGSITIWRNHAVTMNSWGRTSDDRGHYHLVALNYLDRRCHVHAKPHGGVVTVSRPTFVSCVPSDTSTLPEFT